MVFCLMKQGNEMTVFVLVESGGLSGITTTQTFNKCLPRGFSAVVWGKTFSVESTMGVKEIFMD